MDADEEQVHFWGRKKQLKSKIDSMGEDSKYTRQQRSKNSDKAIGGQVLPSSTKLQMRDSYKWEN